MAKYYVYISTSKVDMLLGQISPAYKKKFAGTLGVNVGVFNAKLESSAEQNRAEFESHRLQLVSNYIEQNEKIGTLDEIELWIKDRLDVKHVLIKENPAVFLLVGKRNGRYHLLGGSSHHVIGNVRPSSVEVGYSYFPYLAGAMDSIFVDERSSVALYDFQKLKEEHLAKHHPSMKMVDGQEISNVIWTLFERSNAHPFAVEFIGRFLSKGQTTEGYPCTISSPLYVSQV